MVDVDPLPISCTSEREFSVDLRDKIFDYDPNHVPKAAKRIASFVIARDYEPSFRFSHIVNTPNLLRKSSSYYTNQFYNSSSTYKWNTQYQDLMDQFVSIGKPNADSIGILEALAALGENFVVAAEEYGRQIIREYYLPGHLKTIPAVKLGGQAGGLKYYHDDILFKFAVDQDDLTGDDANAIKIAGHELLSLDCFMACKEKHLSFPLLALINYQGFRLLAISMLPINQSSIIYGSADAGRHIHSNRNRIVEESIARACAKLNLKPHQVRSTDDNIHIMHGPVDLECHVGSDCRYYLVDFARLFPPDKLSDSQRGFLYELLRPELVRVLTAPISSDALSSFIAGLPDEGESFLAVENAHKLLREMVIPNFCRVFERQKPVNLFAHSEDFVFAVHRQGINLRYLGLVYEQFKASNSSWEIIALLEMVARLLKRLFHVELRDTLQHLTKQSAYSEQAVNYKIVSFLNDVFSQSAQSRELWEDFPELLQQHFHYVNNDNARFLQITNERVFALALLRRLQQLTKIEFTFSLDRLERYPLVFTASDIAGVKSHVKHLPLMKYCRGMISKYEASQEEDADKRARHLYQAARYFSEALHCNPSNVDCLLQMASVFRKLNNYQKAKEYYTIAAYTSKYSDTRTNYKLARILHRMNNPAAEQYYYAVLRTDKSNTKCWIHYATFMSEVMHVVSNAEKAFKIAGEHIKWDSSKELVNLFQRHFTTFYQSIRPGATYAEIRECMRSINEEIVEFEF